MTIQFHKVTLASDQYRLAAMYLAMWAARGNFVMWNDERAIEVTEGRKLDMVRWVQSGKATAQAERHGYSSCGDLPHWLYEQLGVRSRWNTQESIDGQWDMGMNLARISGHPDFSTELPEQLSPGDVLYVGHGALDHVCVVMGEELEPSPRIATVDYGQSALQGVEGRFRPSFGWDRQSVPMVHGGVRKVHGYLDLDRVIERARDAGELVAASFPKGLKL